MQLEELQLLRTSSTSSFKFMGSGWDLQTYQGESYLVTMMV